MKKILIITVGVGPNIENAIEYSISQQNPDHIVYVCSPESQKTLQREKLADLARSFEIIEVNSENIQDVVDKLILKIDKINTESKFDTQISLDYTSGSKVISAGAFLAAIHCDVSSFIYVSGSRGPGGIVKSGTEELRTSRLLGIKVQMQKQLLEKYFEIRQYPACLEIIDNILKQHFHTPQEIQLLKKQRNLVSGLIKWDKFDHIGAKNDLQGIPRAEQTIKKIVDDSDKQKQKYHHIRYADNPPYELLILDLYLNAKRRAESEYYEDASARLYRCKEAIGQYLLLSECGIFSEHITSENYNKVPPAVLSQRHKFNQKEEYIQLSLVQLFDTYSYNKPDSPIAILFEENSSKERIIQRNRNQSILAHGFKAIDNSGYSDMLEMVEKYLAAMDIDKSNLKEDIEWCFSINSFKELAK